MGTTTPTPWPPRPIPPSPVRLDQHQIDVAIADIGCRATANVTGIWFAVESAYQRRAIEADRAAFARTRDAIQARDKLAAEADPRGSR